MSFKGVTTDRAFVVASARSSVTKFIIGIFEEYTTYLCMGIYKWNDSPLGIKLTTSGVRRRRSWRTNKNVDALLFGQEEGLRFP